LSVLERDEEGLHHLPLNEVAVELIQLIQPEVVPGKVGVRQVVWISAQVTEVLHQHERFVELVARQISVLGHRPQDLGPRLCAEVSSLTNWSRSPCDSTPPAFAFIASTNCSAVIPCGNSEVKRGVRQTRWRMRSCCSPALAPSRSASWAAGATRDTATSNVPPGYFFDPFAFVRPVVQTGQLIPSSNGTAVAGAQGTDIGNVGRNVLRGPRQTNVDFSVIKRFPFGESKNVEFRAEFFNLFNQANFDNPVSNLNAASVDQNTGQIINPGDFGRIISTSNNPRLIQFALKLSF